MERMRRFREGMGLSDKEVAAFEEYFYHIMAARGSGEHALRHLLAPFARAKHPLEGRLQHIKVIFDIPSRPQKNMPSICWRVVYARCKAM